MAARFRKPAPVATACMLLVVLFAPRADAQVERDLEEARALYGRGRFHEAVVKLRDVASRLERAREDTPSKRRTLADAYLLLALSELALDDRDAAKQSFRMMLRCEPSRRLDPQIYAPKVIELFDEVRREPSSAAPAAAPTGASALAQDRPVGVPHPVSFARMSRLIHPGDEIEVTETSGSSLRGRFVEITASGLRLSVPGGRGVDVPEAQVARVEKEGDSLWNGSLIGAAAGAASMLSCCRSPRGLLIGTSIYAGLGALLDALNRGHTEVYRRGTPADEGPRKKSSLAITPTLGGGQKGLRVSVSF